MRADRSDAGGDTRAMGTRSWIGSWPVYRQLTGTDRRGLGAAAKSGRPRVARTSTADAVVKSVCPYCAVGCAQNVYVADSRGGLGDGSPKSEGVWDGPPIRKVIEIEGDPDSPVSRGPCPKGSASLQLTRVVRAYQVKYRRPFGTKWEDLDLDTAMDMIADRVLAARSTAGSGRWTGSGPGGRSGSPAWAARRWTTRKTT